MLNEWAYARLYRSNADRRRALGRFLGFYNHRRPIPRSAGSPPLKALINTQ
jgi:hypothetical protein